MSNFVTLEEAAKKLGVSTDQLIEMRSRGEIFGYRDGSSWKFKPEEIERVASEMMGDVLDEDPAGSSILSLDPDSNKSGLGSALSGLTGGSGLIIGDGSDYLLAQARQDFSGPIEVCPALEIVRVDSQGTTFKIPDSASEQEFFVRAHGRVLLEDAWCAVAAARAAGLSDSEIAAGLSKFEAVEGRGNAVQSSHGATIVDESYNANPDSMRCAVEAILSHAYPQPDKIVVLGAMAELGDFSEPLHLELGRWLKDKPISLLVTVGPVASAIASGAKGASYEIAAVATQDEALGRVLPRLGRDSCVMVKGSHSTNLDKLVQNILQ